MAVNPTKLLPPSGGALAVRSKTIDIGKKKEGGIEGQVLVIRTQVIKIEKLIARGYTLKLKEQKEERKENEDKKRAKKEEDLETKKPPKEGKDKIPSLPRLGFLDRIRKFISNMLIAYFAVKLIDHLPKLVPFAYALGHATEFLLNVGGNLLNGLVTFVDWGYKAYDATRGFLKNLGGENFAKVFDGFNNAIGTLIETAIVAAVTLSSFGGDGDVSPGAPKKGFDTKGRRVSANVQKRYAQRFGKDQFLKRFGQRNVINLGEKGASKSILKFTKPFLKRLPIIGALIDFGLSVALGEDPGRAAFKAIGAGLFGSIGAAIGSLAFGFGGIVGGILGSIGGDAIGAALYDVFFGNKKPQPKKQKVQGKEGGGITRGGKKMGAIRRTGGVTGKGKIKRKTKLVQKPREIEFENPGADIGGEDKLFGIFPKPKIPDVVNPFKAIENTGKNLGKSDYFGPILAITSKITLGQKPSEQDYKNVGLGINLLFNEGMNKGQLVGGVAAAYAEGGFVDKKTLEAVTDGGDITNWVAGAFKEATETNAQKTLREIKENSKKEKPESSEKYKDSGTSDPSLDIGPGATVTGGNADFWTLVAISRMEDSDPQGSADVAQSIYNRVASGVYGGKTIKEIVLRQGQYEPTWKYPRKGKTGVPNPEWHAIKDLESASVATGISKSDLQKTAAALRNSKYQEEARKFVGGRTDFMGGGNKKGAEDVQRTTNAPNNFFGWFVGPAAKAYGAKNPGPARAPQLGDIVVMGGGGVGTEPLGKGYGSAGGKIAGELGRYIKKKLRQGPDFSQVHRHPEHPPYSLTSGHSKGSLHYQGRAIDIGAHTHEQGPILKVISEFNKMKGVRPVQLLHGRNEPSGHSDHVHVAYEKGGLTKHGPHMAMIGEKGREFVIDADSTAAIERTFPGFLDAVNRAKYDDAIRVLQNFASYESEAPQTVIVQDTSEQDSYQDPMVAVIGGSSVSGDSYDPFAMLDRLSG